MTCFVTFERCRFLERVRRRAGTSFGASIGDAFGARVHLALVRNECSETPFAASFGPAFGARVHLALLRNGCSETSFGASFGAAFGARVRVALVRNGVLKPSLETSFRAAFGAHVPLVTYWSSCIETSVRIEPRLEPSDAFVRTVARGAISITFGAISNGELFR